MNKPSTFAELVSGLIDIIGLFIPLIFAITLLVIIWKVVDAWIFNSGDEGKATEGKQTLFVGIIVLAIMSGLWGILNLLRSSLLGI